MDCFRKLFRWFWKKKESSSRPPITDEQLKVRVVQAIQRVVLEKGVTARYDLIDAKCLAIKYVLEDSPYKIGRKAVVKARKLVDQYEMMFTTGRII